MLTQATFVTPNHFESMALGAMPFEAARAAKDFVTRGIEARIASKAPFEVVWQGA